MTDINRAKIIVLEGPDFAGKSTLAKYLEKQYLDAGYVVDPVHYGPPQDDEDLTYTYFFNAMQWYDDHRDHSKPHVRIYDRLHVGEWVYGNILRDESKLSYNDCTWFDSWIVAHGGTLVYMATTLEDLIIRMSERGDDPFLSKYEETTQGQQVLLLKIWQQYRDYCATEDTNWMPWTSRHSEVLP